MKKLILLLIFAMFVLTASAQVNLDFTINIEDRIYFPNEKIKVDVNVVNREVSFAAKDAVLTLTIADREYSFKLGDIKADQSFSKEITLPEFPPGTHTIKGVLNYTGIFDETFTIETYNSFEVRFPEIERYPRNVNVVGFNLPDKMFAGKTYDVSVVVKNEGTVGGNMIIEVASLEEFADEETFLGPGESKTINLKVNFKNTEVSLIEARVYALINGARYLLVYSGKKAYLEPERVAKLSVDRVEFVDESDNQINQNDEVNLKILLKNTGNYPASSVTATLKSGTGEIEVMKADVNYNLIQNGDTTAPDFFLIKTKNIEGGQYPLILDVEYEDSEKHTILLDIPLSATGGKEKCIKNSDCGDDEVCEDSKCVNIRCDNGYVKDHQCIKYECVKDSDCKNLYTCDSRLRICKPPQCTEDFQCEDDETCSSGKCHKAFTVLAVPLGISERDQDKYLKYAEKELDFFGKISPLGEDGDHKNNLRVHYINPKLCSQVTNCHYDNIQACMDEINRCTSNSGLIGIADKLVAIIDKPIGACGFAFIGGLWSVNLIGCPATPVHEIGHQLDLYHIKCSGTEAGACEGSNAADCKDPNFKSDVMSYCSPEDHYGPYAYQHLKNKYFKSYLEGR
mgnify:CR=1 FL=1